MSYRESHAGTISISWPGTVTSWSLVIAVRMPGDKADTSCVL